MAVRTHIGGVTSFNQVFDPNTLAYVPMVQPSTALSVLLSTQVAVSSVAGVVKIAASDTSVAANSGFHFDGSGNLLTAGGAASSQVSIKEILTSSGGSVMDGTNVAIRVNVVAGSAAGSTEATVRQSTYTDFNTLSRIADRDQSTQVAAVLNSAPASTVWALVTREVAPSTGPFAISSVSGVVAISTGPYSISSIAGVVTVSTGPFAISSIAGVSIVRPEAGSTWTVRPLQSSAADLQVTCTPAAGSTWAVRPLQSSAADLQMTATPLAGSTWNVRPLQSSAADLQVTATPAAGSTFNVRPLQSSQADLRATVYQSSAAEFKTQAWAFDGLGNAIESSTKAGSSATSTARGFVIRSAIPDCTNASAQAASSGDITVFSSAANTIYVYGYSLTTPPTSVVGIVACRFLSGSTNQLWRVLVGTHGIGTGSTNTNVPIIPAQLAVTPPGYLFKTATSAPLLLNITSSGVNYSVAAWRE